ncbi:MAG: hypothetical protein DRO87_12135 [Candidatus Thorarchaeota archaeon]|nr:MAG: hypothetical protein DRO87_12135 [Candidatus Thorarchaeota archaeon]
MHLVAMILMVVLLNMNGSFLLMAVAMIMAIPNLTQNLVKLKKDKPIFYLQLQNLHLLVIGLVLEAILEFLTPFPQRVATLLQSELLTMMVPRIQILLQFQ